MLRNFIAAKILENLAFQPTEGQKEMIEELGRISGDRMILAK